MDIKSAKSIFMVGIKGVGMSALAQILKARGHEVTGWDTTEEFFTDAILKRAGISYLEGNRRGRLGQPTLAIYSQAYTNSHPVRELLQSRGVPQIHYTQAVADSFNSTFGLLVAGSHGKSTVSALLATILQRAGYEPTALIGTEVLGWQSNALAGRGRYFVLEGDEYARAFLAYKPKLLVLTNSDWDHPDTYPTRRSYEAAFRKLVQNLPKEARIVAYSGDKGLSRVLKNIPQRVYWYDRSQASGKLPITLSGEHNRTNAAAAMQAAELLGVARSKSMQVVETFKGTRRRFEAKGKRGSALLFDDYAHHPTEIVATLKAFRERFLRMAITVVFQPHTFSRTKTFIKQFGQSFGLADQVLVLDIYGSAREKKGFVTSQQLVEEIGHKAVLTPTIDAAFQFIEKNMPPHSLLITMGAGDVWKLHRYLLE